MSQPLNRRDVLGLLLAGFATACVKTTPAPAPLPAGPILLGWRWVPGQEYTYRTVIENSRGDRFSSRAEQWTYLVRTLSTQNIASLEGHLSGFGAGLKLGERQLEDEKLQQAIEAERLTIDKRIFLNISMDGHLQSPSPATFENGLAHHMLGLTLPLSPILPGERWASDQVLQPFADLLPARMHSIHSAESQIVSIGHLEKVVTATIETSGSVRTESGENFLGLRGRTIWNAEHGHLMERTLRVTIPTSPEERLVDPGTLYIRTKLV